MRSSGHWCSTEFSRTLADDAIDSLDGQDGVFLALSRDTFEEEPSDEYHEPSIGPHLSKSSLVCRSPFALSPRCLSRLNRVPM